MMASCLQMGEAPRTPSEHIPRSFPDPRGNLYLYRACCRQAWCLCCPELVSWCRTPCHFHRSSLIVSQIKTSSWPFIQVAPLDLAWHWHKCHGVVHLFSVSGIRCQGKCYLPLLMKPSQGSLVAPIPQIGGGDSFFLATRVVCTVVWLSARNFLHICGAEQCIYSHQVEECDPGKPERP